MRVWVSKRAFESGLGSRPDAEGCVLPRCAPRVGGCYSTSHVAGQPRVTHNSSLWHVPLGQPCTQPRVSAIILSAQKTLYQCQIANPSHIFSLSAVRLAHRAVLVRLVLSSPERVGFARHRRRGAFVHPPPIPNTIPVSCSVALWTRLLRLLSPAAFVRRCNLSIVFIGFEVVFRVAPKPPFHRLSQIKLANARRGSGAV